MDEVLSTALTNHIGSNDRVLNKVITHILDTTPTYTQLKGYLDENEIKDRYANRFINFGYMCRVASEMEIIYDSGIFSDRVPDLSNLTELENRYVESSLRKIFQDDMSINQADRAVFAEIFPHIPDTVYKGRRSTLPVLIRKAFTGNKSNTFRNFQFMDNAGQIFINDQQLNIVVNQIVNSTYQARMGPDYKAALNTNNLTHELVNKIIELRMNGNSARKIAVELFADIEKYRVINAIDRVIEDFLFRNSEM